MDSFERVTGRKTDKWLVRTVGTLAAAVELGFIGANAWASRVEQPELDALLRREAAVGLEPADGVLG